MHDVAELLNDMVTNGVIDNYAVFGAVAQIRYTEAVATLDADVLVALPDVDRIDLLKPIYEFCAARGYKPEGEAIRVGNWPVQFIPAFSRLTEDAVRTAEIGDIDGVSLRVVRPDYLAAIAVGVGRNKDFARVLALLETEAASAESTERLCLKYDLRQQWAQFRRRFIDV